MLERYIKYDIEKMVREYEDNKATLVSLKEQYKEVCEFEISGVAYDKDRVQTSPTGDGLENQVIRRIQLERDKNAYENDLALYEMAWGRLTDKERFILTEFCVTFENKQDAVDSVSDYYELERSQVYLLKKDATAKLKRLMFG